MSQPHFVYDHFVAAMEAALSGMLLVDAQGMIVRVNQHVERTFGFLRGELEGQLIEKLLPAGIRSAHVRMRADYLRQPDARPMGLGRELMGMRKDGSQVLVEIGLNPLRTPEAHYVLCSLVDVAERDRAEQARRLEFINRELEEQVRVRTSHLLATLEEREALLREVHHRVRNNLQILSSLVSLQRRQLAQGAAAAPLEQCQTRIAALALVYDRLNQSRDHARVPVVTYARSLCNNLLSMLDRGRPGNIVFQYAIEDVSLALDQAVPCGLLLNELVMNSLKHAFPGERSGHICIELSKRDDQQLVLSVADDGIGLPTSLELDAPGSLGLQLIYTLAQQLDAKVSVQRTAGTKFVFDFRPA